MRPASQKLRLVSSDARGSESRHRLCLLLLFHKTYLRLFVDKVCELSHAEVTDEECLNRTMTRPSTTPATAGEVFTLIRSGSATTRSEIGKLTGLSRTAVSARVAALQSLGLIADDDKSIFHRDDAAFAQFLKVMETTFSLYRDVRGIDHGPIWKGEWREP